MLRHLIVTLIFSSFALFVASSGLVEPYVNYIHAGSIGQTESTSQVESDGLPKVVGTAPGPGEYEPGTILVKMSDDRESNQDADNLLGHPILMRLPRLGVTLLEVEDGQEMDTVAALNARSDVEYAEPDYIYRISVPAYRSDVQANDPLYAEQWGLTAINASAAWALTQGTPDIVIAVVDTGADLEHPDLESKLVGGKSFVRLSQGAQDNEGHGTHVSSIAAAATDNEVGVAGVSWQASIMPVKSLNFFGSGQTSNIAAGIVWAVDNGADIINLSLGSSENSSTLADAIQYASANDVFMVAAMGNEYNQGNPTTYPAAYEEVFAVGAIDQNRNRATFSNTGSHIDVVAPGVDIYGAAIPASGSEYVTLDGTSMATPFVAGLAALLLSVDPTLTNAQLAETIRNTAADLDVAGWDEFTGMGLIDAQAAVESLLVELSLEPSIYLPLHMN